MKNVLLVEDDASVARVLQLTLERQGLDVQWMPNGEAALERMKEHWPDVMITDIMMPRMTGRELCQKIRELYPDRELLIVVMTSMTERYEKEWVKNFPQIIFMEKPLSPRKLVAVLEEHRSGTAG